MKNRLCFAGVVLAVAVCLFLPRLFLSYREKNAKAQLYTTEAGDAIVQTDELTLIDKLRLLASEDSVMVDRVGAVEVPDDTFGNILDELYSLLDLGAITDEMLDAFLGTESFTTTPVYIMNPTEQTYCLLYKISSSNGSHYALYDPETSHIFALTFPMQLSLPQDRDTDSKSEPMYTMMMEAWSAYFDLSPSDEGYFEGAMATDYVYRYYFRLTDGEKNAVDFSMETTKDDGYLAFMPISEQAYAESAEAQDVGNNE